MDTTSYKRASSPTPSFKFLATWQQPRYGVQKHSGSSSEEGEHHSGTVSTRHIFCNISYIYTWTKGTQKSQVVLSVEKNRDTVIADPKIGFEPHQEYLAQVQANVHRECKKRTLIALKKESKSIVPVRR